MRPSITSEIITAMQDLRRQGYSTKEIAKIHNVSIGSSYKYTLGLVDPQKARQATHLGCRARDGVLTIQLGAATLARILNARKSSDPERLAIRLAECLRRGRYGKLRNLLKSAHAEADTTL